MPASELQAKVDAFDFWYHRIELPDGIVTPGWAPISADMYDIPDNLTGKRVLDVGAWDGYWTFEALKRGAAEVVAIDDFSDHLGLNVTRTAWDTFDLCRDAIGYSEAVCKRQEITVYDITPEEFGIFDVVFCLVLYIISDILCWPWISCRRYARDLFSSKAQFWTTTAPTRAASISATPASKW